MSIADKQKSIIAEFEKFKTWEERYQHIIGLGKTLSGFPEEHRTEANKVKGCQSQVWMHAALVDGKIIYHIDSDAMIVKGLAAILHSVFSGHSPSEVIGAGVEFLEVIGLTSHLSQSRSNGLAAMVRQFKNYAVVFQAMQR